MDADGEGMALDAATEARVRTALSVSGPMPDGSPQVRRTGALTARG